MQNRICESTKAALIVPSLSLDGSGLPVPDVIKMDVEGAESAVLKGAQRVLREIRPVVFVALHGQEQREACVATLRDAGYDICDLEGQSVDGMRSVDEIYAVPAKPSIRA